MHCQQNRHEDLQEDKQSVGYLPAVHTTRDVTAASRRGTLANMKNYRQNHISTTWGCDVTGCYGNTGEEEVKLTGYVGMQLNLLYRQTSCPQ